MKLTEERKEQIEWVQENCPSHATPTEKGYWMEGAHASIEKFGGIQWNKYPETKPEIGEYVDIITDNKRRITDCETDQGGFYHREDDLFFTPSHVTHWAYINLPESD